MQDCTPRDPRALLTRQYLPLLLPCQRLPPPPWGPSLSRAQALDAQSLMAPSLSLGLSALPLVTRTCSMLSTSVARGTLATPYVP